MEEPHDDGRSPRPVTGTEAGTPPMDPAPPEPWDPGAATQRPPPVGPASSDAIRLVGRWPPVASPWSWPSEGTA